MKIPKKKKKKVEITISVLKFNQEGFQNLTLLNIN